MEPVPSASKRAPGRLVTVEPNTPKSPAPDQRMDPAFSSVRPPPKNAVAMPGRFRVAPVSTIVRPVPLMLPPTQKLAPCRVRVPAPETVGEPAELPRVRPRHSASLFSVTVTEFVIKTLSFGPGTRLGVQLAGTNQSPPAAFVQMMSMGRKWANRVLLLVIVIEITLLSVVRSPVQPWNMPGGNAVAVRLTVSPLV